MLAVNVRELKSRLSAYLREVQKGQTVLVSERGRIVAELRAPSQAALPEDSEIVRAAVKLGLPPPPRTPRLSLRAHTRPKRTATARELRALLDFERGERF